MTTAQYLEAWRSAGVITDDQCAALSALARKDRFSVHLELNALLYAGVLAFAAGLGWTVREHFANLGDAVIVFALCALVAGSLSYCLERAAPYSSAQVPSATFAFDYVLLLGCLAFAVALWYIEFRFQLLRERWDNYLLASAGLYLALAYRFDNRFVLSLGLSTLAGWFGVRFSPEGFFTGAMRNVALGYGILVAAVGVWMHRLCVKAHFLETYFHVAANAMLFALASGVFGGDSPRLWLLGLLVAAAAAIEWGIHVLRFAFVVYGVVYAYVGVSREVVRHIYLPTLELGYFVVSGVAAVVGLFVVSRRVGREE
jgi:Predicted membrane protein (DUF2157)